MQQVKRPLFLLFSLLICLFPMEICAQWNFDNSYTAVPAVSVKPYAPVQKIEGQDSNLCLGLAISGGGSRAQYFGTGVLMELSELEGAKKQKFLTEVDYFSSVSGGGFAIGYYMMVRKIGLLQTQSYFDYWKSDIPYSPDGLQSYVFVPASQWTTFKLRSYERHKNYKNSYPQIIDNELLKANRSQALIPQMVPQLFLSDFFVPYCDTCIPKLPMFVANTTIYPNCERLPLMPHILADLKINRSIIPQYPFKDDSGYNFPLAFALASSSAVPGVLPIQKLGTSDTYKSIRAIDGGVVDNLGLKTLFELLISDDSQKKNKKMLVVDCSGIGNQNRYSEIDDHIGLLSLLKESSFFTVASKNLVAKEMLDILEKAESVPTDNGLVIGMQDIREEIKKSLSNDDKAKIDEYKSLWKPSEELTNKVFEEMYRELAATFKIGTAKKDPPARLGNIVTSDVLAKASNPQKFLIYEMASHVITKVKIDEWEQEILILAGRLLVLENKQSIINLLE